MNNRSWPTCLINGVPSALTASQRQRNVCGPSLLYHTFTKNCFPGQHTVRGATKEKTRKLDELKARRKAKDEKKRVGAFNNDPWPGLTRDDRRTHPQSGIALHLPWIWRSQTKSQKMARSQSKIRKRKKNEGCSARLLLRLTTRHRPCNILRAVDCQEIHWQSTVWRHGFRITSVVRNITTYGLQ